MNWQSIGIRVPHDSDLPNRLKKLSESSRLAYHELLEKFIARAEAEESEELNLKNTIATESIIERIQNLEKEVIVLKKGNIKTKATKKK